MRLAVCLLLLACDAGGATLRIDLRTDFVPEDELVRVDVTLDGETQTTTITAGDDWLAGARIATFETGGSVEARVRLIGLQESVLAERTLRAEVRDDVGRTVVVTRDCRGVACPDACVGGKCASSDCSPETPELCPEPTCATDLDCSVIAQCAVARCVGGECFQAPGECAVDQFCDPDVGCRAKSATPPSCENPIDITGLSGEQTFNTCGFRDVGQGECSPEGAADAFFTFVTPPGNDCIVRRDNRTSPALHFIAFDACNSRDRCFGGFAHSTTGPPDREVRSYFSVETDEGCGVFTLTFECTPRDPS